MKKLIFSLFISLFIIFDSYVVSIWNSDYSKGPLYGKNMYVPFLIYYNFPSVRAKSGKEFEFNYHISNYIIQDFYSDSIDDSNAEFYKRSNYKKLPLGEAVYIGPRYYTTQNIIRDYESLVTEVGFSFYILKRLQVGIDFRLFAYYTGFMDTIIENFHHAFGFPGGAREYFEQNKIFVNILNHNGINLYLDKPAVSFGDIDMWVKYTFFERNFISLAGFGAFKIPTGSIANLSGSGYPDFALGVLADFKPAWILSFYLQSGLVVPFDSFLPVKSKPYPMFNGLVGIELHPANFFSLIVQFNVKTSPISGDKTFSWNENYKLYDLPQVNT
ncbi:MAG TPA: DUF3187 family protein, partial [Spirochaetota bacterium]|nr:DUF3187 family protein [Spirochaetota bacterium]